MSRLLFRIGKLELVWATPAPVIRLDIPRRRVLPSIYDQATTWYEPWYFSLRLDEEVARSRRHSLDLAVIAFAIDDLGGPLSPLRLDLNNVMSEFAATLRISDIPGVVDRERFAIALPQTGRAGAATLLHRLAAALAPFEPRIGLAVFPADAASADDLLARAFTPPVEGEGLLEAA
jgi:hypothetical protein